jgi:uncharacterized protein (DUF849 family)
VERITAIARLLHRDIATPAQARRRLDLRDADLRDSGPR